MSRRWNVTSCGPWIVAGLILASGAGCDKSQPSSTQVDKSSQTTHADEHDHAGHDHEDEHAGPETYAAGVAELNQLVTQIADACKSQDTQAAHDPLHDIGNLLQRLPELAADSELAEADWTVVKTAADKLFAIYSEIDGLFHQGPAGEAVTVDYAKFEPTILAELEVLTDKVEASHGDHPE